jgi:glycosyltransferase involved in cell wall biosynthesis
MSGPTRPLVTMLLICFNQENTIDAAIDGALVQDYPNLEIVISDDASSDSTYARINTKLQDYAGPHTIKVQRNPQNLGIGGNLDKAVRQSHGALIFIAAGDDVSLPRRVSTVVQYWLDKDQKPDLIAAYLNDIDTADRCHGVIQVSDLSIYCSLEDWSRRGPPHVIGAAQAWTRRLFDRFGGIPSGVVGEDMVMAFRAIASGNAVTLPIALVNYRRGGLTSQRKSLSAAQVTHGLTRKLRSSQTEMHCLLNEAKASGASLHTLTFIAKKLDKEVFIEGMFTTQSVFTKLRLCYLHSDQPADFRIRIFIYAVAPWLLAPFFYMKRRRHR